MLIIKVKICGITNYKDAKAAIDMGADLIGFNFYQESPRYIPPEKAVEIISKLPAFVDTVGLFVNSSLNEIQEMVNTGCLNWIQLHGDENPKFCNELASLSVKTIKAIRVKDKNDIEKANHFFTDVILLDAYHPEKYGGTGCTFDWNIVGHIGKRIFLAGGITPDNVENAAKLGVYGIDICSGIESGPGKKDHKKMKELFKNIRHLRG
ncbi:MAG: phosphoribosylanthranilate isomerase [Planctomycetota bacterium]